MQSSTKRAFALPGLAAAVLAAGGFACTTDSVADDTSGLGADAAPTTSQDSAPDAAPASPTSPGTDNRCLAPSEAPGTPLYTTDDVGGSECTTTTVGAAIAAVQAAHPEVAGITTIYDPRGGIADGTYVYVFQRPDGGLDLAFKRGSGDCPSGCTANEAWYFESGASCAFTQVGHTDTSLACIPPSEQPRWGVPRKVDPSRLCGADSSPQQLPSTLPLIACGTSSTCAGDGHPTSRVVLTITQDPADLGSATVALGETGIAELDGRSWPATVTGSSLLVDSRTDNLPSPCPESETMLLQYDLSGFGIAHVSYQHDVTTDCDAAASTYCKAGLEAELRATPD